MNDQSMPAHSNRAKRTVNRNDVLSIKSKNRTKALVTVITSKEPEILTKSFRLEAGELQKEAGGILVSGGASVRTIGDAQDLIALLKTLTPNQALTYGVPPVQEVALVTKRKWKSLGKPADPLPRTNETFSWPKGRGILMVDYDPEDGKPALTADELIAKIRHAAPGLSDVTMVSWPSASSWIKNAETGEWVKKGGGQRIYMFVDAADDIPRAGQTLFDRLWLAGHGYIKISSAGSIHLRTLVDGSVWQTSRLDFAAGAECTWPLVQERGEPRLITGTQETVNTATALPDLTIHEQKVLRHIQSEARAEREEEAAKIKEVWLEKRARKVAGLDATREEFEKAKNQANQALETRCLSGGFLIEIEMDGHIREVSVDEVLAEPDQYNGALTKDPIEPDYDGGRIVGKLYLEGTPKTLHSLARGGITYILKQDVAEIQIVKGKLHEAVEMTLGVLRSHPSIYDFGDELAWVEGGKIHSLDQPHLEQRLGAMVQYWSFASHEKKVLKDPPTDLTKRLLAMGKLRALKQIAAVITAPTIRLDGTILDKPGYDTETKLYYHPPENTSVPTIPQKPSIRQVKSALDTLLAPFSEFPFVDRTDRGVFLAALLTAAVRRILPTAPGFGFDAPVQGSGKTLLAQCIASLAGENNSTIYPHTQSREDEEVRKRLMSFFRTGSGVMIWDNVMGTFDSPALAAALTSETFTDRILGRSESVSLPNRAMFIFTGNNLTLQGDMVRRILVCRIDPRIEKPFERRFEFDPLAHVRSKRSTLIAAALTLLRGGLIMTGYKPDSRLASFEAWSDLVRDTVCWIDQTVVSGEVGDPMQAITRTLEFDPELEINSELLNALWNRFAAESFTSSDVYKEVRGEPVRIVSGRGNAIWVALMAISESAARSAATIGKVLTYRKDRIAGEFVLRQSKDGHSKTSLWRVERRPAEDAEDAEGKSI